MLLARWGGNRALVIAVGEPRCKFSQIALPDCLTAERTERLRAGCPAIHQDKFHMPTPRSVSCIWTRVASRQQRKLQMRSLQRKFIGEPPRLQDPLHPSPRKAAVKSSSAETHRQSDIRHGRRGLMGVARSETFGC